eukprot:SAG11_NODE_24301_length_375_cov_1.061594_1_plen_30_part_10
MARTDEELKQLAVRLEGRIAAAVANGQAKS